MVFLKKNNIINSSPVSVGKFEYCLIEKPFEQQ